MLKNLGVKGSKSFIFPTTGGLASLWSACRHLSIWPCHLAVTRSHWPSPGTCRLTRFSCCSRASQRQTQPGQKQDFCSPAKKKKLWLRIQFRAPLSELLLGNIWRLGTGGENWVTVADGQVEEYGRFISLRAYISNAALQCLVNKVRSQQLYWGSPDRRI